jgi:serine protease
MNILSASLGGGSSTTTDNAINNAAANGVIPVVAAGNDSNQNACNYSPAGAAQAITVAASTSQDARASFSNSGSCVDVFAPGQSIHSSWYTSSTTYNTISGTSMATPLAAGAIAVFGTTNGQLNARVAAVKTAIRSTGTANVITGTLLAGTPNILINSQWN